MLGGAMLSLVATTGCGGGSGSASTGSDSGSGEASVTALSAVPSLDLSTLDSSESSANLAVRTGKRAPLLKSISSDTGKPSREGCEVGMHKRQLFRMSQEVQLPRCFLEAIASAGLMTIPTGSRSIYDFRFPEPPAGEQDKQCDDIPEERTEEIEACEAGDEGPSDPLVRIGIIDGALQIDHCEANGSDTRRLVEEATYVASGSNYTIDAAQNWSWGGQTEQSRLLGTIDLGTTGSVTNGVVELGDGNVSITGYHSGGFGQGMESYGREGSTNIVSGAFEGSFIDPFSGSTSSFTGRAYAQYDATVGTGKFSFTGSPPAMRVSDMIPFHISTPEEIEAFLKIWKIDLGAEITLESKLCPNPNFNPEEDEGSNIKPMILLAAGETDCESITHTGVESFAITNVVTEGDFGNTVKQVYTTISNADSPFYDAVSVFDISALSTSTAQLGFSRNWDCGGSATIVDMGNLTQAQFATLDAAMETCFALEEKLHGNNGMGEYDCHQEEQQDDINDLAEENDDGGEKWGVYGGDLELVSEGCSVDPPDFIPVDPIDIDANRYCIDLDGGECTEVTVSGGIATSTATIHDEESDLSLVQIDYSDDALTAVATWQNAASQTCTATYEHFYPGEGVFFDEDGDSLEGETELPEPCLDAGMDPDDPKSLDKCAAYCSGPGADC